MQTRRLLPALSILVAAIGLLAAACSGSSSGSAEVASLGGGGAAGTSPPTTAANTKSMQEASLEFAACMREHGVDMPDPTFDENGRPQRVEGQGRTGPAGMPLGGPDADPAQRAAFDTCRSKLEGVIGNFRPDPARQAEMRDQMLAFAACMRENGVDMPDPTFDENGRPQMNRQGQTGGGPLGSPSQDDDPTFTAARQACQDKLPRPGSGGGPGGGNGGADTTTTAGSPS